MIQDADLFVALAEIAGVFVGFGALISFTRRSEISAADLIQIRTVVVTGLVVVVAALFPVGLSRYGLTDHALWLWSSVFLLLIIWSGFVIPLRNPQHRAAFAHLTQGSRVANLLFLLFLEVFIQLPLILVVLGSHPSLEPAFYTTALIVNLFQAALVLTQLVFSQTISPDR